MNIIELDALIAAIPSDDKEMLYFYKGKRKELMADMSKDVQKIIDEAA